MEKVWERWLFQTISIHDFYFTSQNPTSHPQSRNKTLRYDAFTPPWFPSTISSCSNSYEFEKATILGLRQMRSDKGYIKAIWTLGALFHGSKDFFQPAITHVFTNANSILRTYSTTAHSDGQFRRTLAPRRRQVQEKRPVSQSSIVTQNNNSRTDFTLEELLISRGDPSLVETDSIYPSIEQETDL